jgi:hypothetical protein
VSDLTDLDSVDRLARPVWLRNHRALALLSEGGVGQVFLVEGPAGDLRAAKVLHRELAERPDAVTCFLDLARALERLSHPNLVRVFDSGRLADGRPFLVMEYARGRQLGELMVDPVPRHHERVTRLAIDIASGLAAAHDAGLVHGDLTPSNLLVIGEGNDAVAKVMDFDFLAPAGVRVGPSTEPDAIGSGTPEYWSPEQATGQAIDARSDIYSLGVVLYELLSGRVPFRSHAVVEVAAQHLHVEPPPLTPLAGTVPPPRELCDVVQRCLAKRPADRFQSAVDLRAALHQVVNRRRASSASRGGEPRAASEPRRWRVAPFATIGVAVGLVALVLIAVAGPGRSSTPAAVRAPATVNLALTSQPSGAFVFHAEGGPILGKTPFDLSVSRAPEPLDLVFRFPDGSAQHVLVVPDRPARLHARSPGEISATSRDSRALRTYQGASTHDADLSDL